MPTINGNDISHFQGIINFDVYKNNSNFVVMKATEGTSYVDSAFSLYQKEARRVGLELGVYHFCRPDLGNLPEVEADFFLQTVGQPQDGEFFALDYECPNQKQSDIDWCKKFMDRVLSKIGVRCLIYLNQSEVIKFDWSTVVSGNYGLWLAAYSNNPLDNNFKTGQFPYAVMRQWTNTQTVPGIPGKVDGDIFFSDLPTLKKYGYKTVVTPPTNSDVIANLTNQINSLNTKITLLQSLQVQALAQKDADCQQKISDFKQGVINFINQYNP